MKKLFTLTFLSLTLLSVVCFGADKASEAPSQTSNKEIERYDFSSMDNLFKSFEKECEKDGVDPSVVMGAFFVVDIKDGFNIKILSSSEEKLLSDIKKIVANRSPREFLEYAKGFSKEDSTPSVSFQIQTLREEVNMDVADKALEFIATKEYATEFAIIEDIEDFDECTEAKYAFYEKIAGERSLKEIIEYVDGLGLDYSSKALFDMTLFIQCQKYEIDSLVCFRAMESILSNECKEAFDAIDSIEDWDARNNLKVKYFEQFIGNKSLKEIIELADKLNKK